MLDESCIPILQCQCCECKGRMCLMWHPGHSHNTTLDDLLGQGASDLLEKQVEVLKESILDTDFGGD